MKCYICDNTIDNPTWDEHQKPNPCSVCQESINEVKTDYFITDVLEASCWDEHLVYKEYEDD